jgi:hypothetical protein
MAQAAMTAMSIADEPAGLTHTRTFGIGAAGLSPHGGCPSADPLRSLTG